MHHTPIPLPGPSGAAPAKAEAERMAALLSLGVLDTAPEPQFDALVRAAALVCAAPMALISLPAADRVWLKAAVGLHAAFLEGPGRGEIGRRAMATDAYFEIRDTRLDPRFAANPLVTGPAMIRSCAGAPIMLNSGHRVGTLFVAYHKPRRLKAAQREALVCLAQAVAHALDARGAGLQAQRVAEQLRSMARVAQLTTNAVIITDVAGRITWVNEGFERITGYRHDEALGLSPGRLLQCEGSDPGVVARIRAALQAGRDFQGEILNRGKDGRLYTIELEIQPLHDAQGVLYGFMAIELDITERKAAMARLEATAEAQKAFIATVSHELRSPLQSVIGYAELGRLMTSEQAAFDSLFAAVHAGGHRMLRLVNDLLDVAKIDGDVETLSLHREDLKALAATVVEEMLPLAEQRGVRITLPPGVQSLPADVDGFRFQQVVRNLLSNALRFAPAGSEIEVEGRDLGTQGVELSVRDHGPGIPENELETVFAAFAQSSRTRKAAEGTGLGLTICRKLLAAHGGRISAAQAPGGGALVVLWLPQSVRPAGSPPPAPVTDVVHLALS